MGRLAASLVGIFEDSSKVGRDMVNEHCREHHGEMQNHVNNIPVFVVHQRRRETIRVEAV